MVLLKRLLISIKEKMKSVEYDIIVVDNNSEDGSVEFLKNYSLKTVLIENKTNVGFSKANNQGSKLANGRYLLFLNSDTLVRDGAVEKMLEYLQREQSTAIVGPKLLNQDDTLQRSCGIFPNLRTEFSDRTFLNRLFPTSKVFGTYKLGAWDYGTEKKVDWISAACIFIRKDVFEQIGGYSSLPLMEAAHLCKKLREIGNLGLIKTPIITSSRRFEQGGILKIFWLDTVIWFKNFVGMNIQSYASSYWSRKL